MNKTDEALFWLACHLEYVLVRSAYGHCQEKERSIIPGNGQSRILNFQNVSNPYNISKYKSYYFYLQMRQQPR